MAQPPNDACADAIPLTPGDVVTAMTGAATSVDFPGSCAGFTSGNGVWYSVTPGTGPASFSLCDSDFDTFLNLYSGSCGALTCVSGNDDSFAVCGNSRSYIEANLVEGTQYYLLASGFSNVAGTIVLESTFTEAPVACLPGDIDIECPMNIIQANVAGLCTAVVTYAEPTALPCPNPVSMLAAGDIAFTAYDGGAESFSFVILTDILSGTEIRFTDNGWLMPADAFRTGEGNVYWTADMDYPAGTEVTIATLGTPVASIGVASIPGGGGAMALSNSGDQVFAYQGDFATPTLIAGLNNQGSDWQAAGTSSAGESSLPPALSTGESVALVEMLTTAYDCSTISGTADELRAAVNDAANWAAPGAACAFDVLPTPIAVTLTAGLASGSDFPVGTTTVTYTANDGNGNTAECSFDVTVTDTDAPIISCPADQTILTSAAGTGACEVILPDYSGLAVASDLCGAVTVTQLPAAGTGLTVGDVEVITLTAEDESGNTASCTFSATGVDDTPPSLCESLTYTVSQAGAFAPIDISAIGTALTLGDDALSDPVPLGFDFNFFGNSYQPDCTSMG